MNGIGIDLCVSTCRVMIKEGASNDASFVPVSDGVRRAIPVAAHAEGRWGSAALAGDEAASVDPSAFLRGLRKRLSDHLGGLQPDLSDGYDVTLACESTGGDARTSALGAALRAAGFAACRVVAPVDALLVAWLRTRPTRPPPTGTIVAAVCCGETRTEVRAYRFEQRYPATSSEVVVLDMCGHAPWRDHLRARLAERSSQPMQAAPAAAIDDSIIEMARALAAAAPNAELTWRGAGAAHLFAPLVLSPAEAATWPGVAALRTALPAALREAATALGAPRPMAVALGGVGAVWPFARQALAASGHEVWVTKDPLDAVATGAAAWSDVGPALGTLAARLPAPSPDRRSGFFGL